MNANGKKYKIYSEFKVLCHICNVSFVGILINLLVSFFGIESWLKKRWRTLRNDYRRITIYNHTHSDKAPIHKMANHLDFLTIDLNGANNMNFDDLKYPKSESFHVTKEMLDDCDIAESVTFESITMPKALCPNLASKSNALSPSSVKIEIHPKETDQNRSEYSAENAIESNDKPRNTLNEETETRSTNSNAEQRCEDEIFGDYVVAMLKKLPSEEKKRVKKEIINILL